MTEKVKDDLAVVLSFLAEVKSSTGQLNFTDRYGWNERATRCIGIVNAIISEK